jgi:hypothetical protein
MRHELCGFAVSVVERDAPDIVILGRLSNGGSLKGKTAPELNGAGGRTISYRLTHRPYSAVQTQENYLPIILPMLA